MLEILGLNISIAPEKSAELLRDINFCFLFAQNYHIAMKYVAPIRTVFNILGPLSNSAGANRELTELFNGYAGRVEQIAKAVEGNCSW